MSKPLLIAATLAAATFAVGCGDGNDPSRHKGKPTTRVSPERCSKVGWKIEPAEEEGRIRCVPPVIATNDECRATGSLSVQVDDTGGPATCFLNTPDAGGNCEDSVDCAGFCEAPQDAHPRRRWVGTCSYHTDELCWNELKKGIPQGVDCLLPYANAAARKSAAAK